MAEKLYDLSCFPYPFPRNIKELEAPCVALVPKGKMMTSEIDLLRGVLGRFLKSSFYLLSTTKCKFDPLCLKSADVVYVLVRHDVLITFNNICKLDLQFF